MKAILVALIAIVGLAGCATTKTNSIENSDRLAVAGSVYEAKATAYVLRDASMSGMVWPVNVKLDDVSQGSIRRETYVKFGIFPGRHTLLAAWPSVSGEPDAAVSAEFSAGKTYYFVFSPSFEVAGPMMRYGASLVQVDGADASKRLRIYENRSAMQQ